MSQNAKFCTLVVWAFLGLLTHSHARYIDSSKDDVVKNVGNVDDVERSLQPQFGVKDLVPVESPGFAFDVVPPMFWRDDADEYMQENAVVPSYKRTRGMGYRKRSEEERKRMRQSSNFNRLVQRLLGMRGETYHYSRVTPVRFGGGRRR